MYPTSEKASYKEIHLPLGVVGVCTEERPWPILEKGARARKLSIYLQKKKTSKDHRLDPKRGRRRVGLPWACEPTARGVRSEGCPCSLHQPRYAPSGWLLAPRAPLGPKHRARSAPSSGARLPLGRAEAHSAALPLQLLGCGRVRGSKRPDV